MTKYLLHKIRLVIIAACILPFFFTTAWGETPAFEKLNVSDSPESISLPKIQGPLDFCDEPIPLDDPEVYERLEYEMLLFVWNNSQVIFWIKRSGRYMSYIEEILKKNNLPDDLKYIVIIESSLLPHAGSSKGAVGFWQFIKETGTRYGITINSNIDDRRNIFISTQAAADYLKELYKKFDSWALAAAAYNMGEAGLQSEMLVQRVTDYYKLYLPVETQRYVFRIVAAKIILSDPQKYGFKLTNADLYPPLQFDRVALTCSQDTPIHVIAQAANTYFKVIKDLNHQIRGYYLCKGNHAILVPKGAGKEFQPRFDQFLKQWLSEREKNIYEVQRGDTLSSIAARFNVTITSLRIWNRLNDKNNLSPGDHLIIYPSNSTTKQKE
jgi:hypothetical protein